MFRLTIHKLIYFNGLGMAEYNKEYKKNLESISSKLVKRRYKRLGIRIRSLCCRVSKGNRIIEKCL